MVDFSFIVSLYVSDLPNVTISTVPLLGHPYPYGEGFWRPGEGLPRPGEPPSGAIARYRATGAADAARTEKNPLLVKNARAPQKNRPGTPGPARPPPEPTARVGRARGAKAPRHQRPASGVFPGFRRGPD